MGVVNRHGRGRARILAIPLSKHDTLVFVEEIKKKKQTDMIRAKKVIL